MTGADIYMKTCKEKALEWNVSPRSVNDMCKKGRIQGAIKEKGSWLIPDDSPKPMDGRVSNGKYIKKNMVAKAEVKSLPIGISDYVRAQEEYYYVDKTLLIKEFLDQKPLVSLFTRPRRFGKTLNMDMLRVFFEISDKNTSKYFADKNIWQCGEEYRSHQGKYPVIFLTFKDVKFDTWDATIEKIRGLLQEEYGRHQELLNSDKLSQYEKEYFTKIISATANEVELTSSLERLSKMLASHYDKAPVIIIDEYDTPIQGGYSKDFYDEIIGFMRNFFSGAFKDNKNLSYGFLRTTANKIAESLYANDYKKLQSAIGEYMDKSISFFDGGAEGFYHGLMLGLIALMDNQYKIKSNRESGDGRFDVSLIPREKRYPGIILELKWKEKLSDVELEKWSNEALKQIGELRYDSEMKEDGITEILKFGIAFSGKKVCVRTE